MIAFLTGRVAGKGIDHALVEVSGVGFRLAMSTSSLASLPAEGDEVTVHTYLHVREDELSLFGFESAEERMLFERLIGVQGVGPKVALAVLSSLTPDAFREALAREDVPMLSSVPGVGKKTAQRLIIELKDKLDLPDLAPGSASADADAVAGARAALVSMGFSTAEAAAATGSPASGASAEQVLRDALRALGGGR